jgi:hypothetical protein
VGYENEGSQKDERIFGMSLEEVNSTADELSQQKDRNHPTKTGSYKDFLETMRKGRDRLLNQENYNQHRLGI